MKIEMTVEIVLKTDESKQKFMRDFNATTKDELIIALQKDFESEMKMTQKNSSTNSFAAQ